MGKTTIATKFPRHLLIAFEKGYSAIPGAMAQPVNSWSEFRKVLKELKNPEVQNTFETIVIDTADIAFDYCETYICNQEGVDAINQVPFGGGYTKVAKEFDSCLRSIVQMNYGLVIISHAADKTFTNEQGLEYNQIVPTLGNKARLIGQRMCDIIGYSRGIETPDGLTTRLFMRGTPRYIAGSRFKYTPDSIEFTYQNLVNAINEAIDKQAEEDGQSNFTDVRSTINTLAPALDFDEIVTGINKAILTLMDIDKDKFAPQITEIVERYLGKGKKLRDATRDQVEQVDLILADLKDLI